MTLLRSPRILTLLALSTCALAASLLVAQPGVAKPKTYKCPNVTAPAGLNGGYLNRIKATGYASKSSACRSAKKVVLAYYKCRRAKGVKGSCSGRTINSLKCTERRGDVIPTEFNATVTCKKGSKKVVHTYQQNIVSG